MKMIQEFKDFAVKGNAIDLAVGVVIGATFGQIVNSLVQDIINPLISLVTGNIDFSDKSFVLREATETAVALTLNYGKFFTVLINFLIVSFSIFLVIKQLNKFKTQHETKTKIEKGPSEVELLTEIRDSLRK